MKLNEARTWIDDIIIDLAKESVEGFGLVFMLDQSRCGAEISGIGLSRADGGALARDGSPDGSGEVCQTSWSCETWLLGRPPSVEGCLGAKSGHW